MNPESLDRLSRRMGAATSRRGLLKAFVAGLAGALAALRAKGANAGVTVVEPGSSAGRECNTSEYTKSCGKVTQATSSGQRTYDFCCAKDATCCNAANAACCAPDQQCCGGKACCDPTQICQDGECKSCGSSGIAVNNTCCPADKTCSTPAGYVCCTNGSCTSNAGGSQTCCPSANVCKDACCTNGQECTNDVCCDSGLVGCKGVCCASGQTCRNDTCCDAGLVGCYGTCCGEDMVCTTDGMCCYATQAYCGPAA